MALKKFHVVVILVILRWAAAAHAEDGLSDQRPSRRQDDGADVKRWMRLVQREMEENFTGMAYAEQAGMS